MKPLLYYVPTLHKDYAPVNVREAVRFFPVGLSAGEGEGVWGVPGSSGEPGHAGPYPLPLTPAEARAVLQELLQLGALRPDGGMPRRPAPGSLDRPGRRTARLATDEEQALRAFTASGEASEAPEAGADRQTLSARERLSAVREALVDCQKVLLLAHSLEERMAEAAHLENRLLGAEQALHASLGEGGPVADVADVAGVADVANDVFASPVPWRIMLGAVLPFLPQNAALFTADGSLAAELREHAGVRPCTVEDTRPYGAWAEERTEQLWRAVVPGRILAGERSVPAAKPWLDRDVVLFVEFPHTV